MEISPIYKHPYPSSLYPEMGKAELLYYCPFTSLALDGDVEEETSSFKFFLLFTYKYLELLKITCDFMFMI